MIQGGACSSFLHNLYLVVMCVCIWASGSFILPCCADAQKKVQISFMSVFEELGMTRQVLLSCALHVWKGNVVKTGRESKLVL